MHLLNVIGKDGQEMFETFSLSDTDHGDIGESPERIRRQMHVSYPRDLWELQEPGESLDHYLTDIIKGVSMAH